MSIDGDAALADRLHRLVTDLLCGFDDHPFGPSAECDSLRAVTGLLVDVLWWLDTTRDDAQQPDCRVLKELPDEQRERLLDVLHELALEEQHDGRRYELRLFPFWMGLVEHEPDDEAPVRTWVDPAARAAVS